MVTDHRSFSWLFVSVTGSSTATESVVSPSIDRPAGGSTPWVAGTSTVSRSVWDWPGSTTFQR